MLRDPRLARVLSGTLALASGALGCRTREDGARRAGHEAALAVVSACPVDGGETDLCREPICRARCAPFADSTHLTETCTAQCMGQGTCDSDTDCVPGLVCVTIAPRLRRCERARDPDR